MAGAHAAVAMKAIQKVERLRIVHIKKGQGNDEARNYSTG